MQVAFFLSSSSTLTWITVGKPLIFVRFYWSGSIKVYLQPGCLYTGGVQEFRFFLTKNILLREVVRIQIIMGHRISAIISNGTVHLLRSSLATS